MRGALRGYYPGPGYAREISRPGSPAGSLRFRLSFGRATAGGTASALAGYTARADRLSPAEAGRCLLRSCRSRSRGIIDLSAVCVRVLRCVSFARVVWRSKGNILGVGLGV